MMTRYDCRMNGMGLSDVDEDIVITDIREGAPSLKLTTGSSATGDGLRLLSRVRQTLSVTISFEVRIQDVSRRAQVLNQVAVWARDGVLTVNYRPDQQLHAVCTALPSIGSALKWTDTLSITFTAYASPFWESAKPVTAASTTAARAHTLTLRPTGTAVSCPLWCDVTNAATANITTVTIICGTGRFTLNGLSLAPGKTLSAAYDADGRLMLRAGGASVMDKRTADSADDLLVHQREQNDITVSADQPCTVIIKAWGRSL